MSLPSNFPAPEARSFGNLISNTLQSTVDGTNILRRRIGTDLNQASFNLNYILSGEQFDEFIEFFEDTIDQGFNYFQLPILDNVFSGKIISGYSASPVGLSWRLSFNFVAHYSLQSSTGRFVPLSRIVPANMDFREWCPEIDALQTCTTALKSLRFITTDLFPPL